MSAHADADTDHRAATRRIYLALQVLLHSLGTDTETRAFEALAHEIEAHAAALGVNHDPETPHVAIVRTAAG